MYVEFPIVAVYVVPFAAPEGVENDTIAVVEVTVTEPLIEGGFNTPGGVLEPLVHDGILLLLPFNPELSEKYKKTPA